jgi:SDR family mycofactocin-dependent oxidoreductase
MSTGYEETLIMGRVAGKVALVTGAGRGQGRNHAIRLAQEGAAIIAVDYCKQIDSVPYPLSGPGDLSETERLITESGGQVVAVEADVRDLDGMAEAVATGVERFGRLDIVAANAGIFSSGAAHLLSADSWRDMIDVNLTGVWHTARAAIPAMIEGGKGGSIVITSSIAGLKGSPNASHYVAAKHGVVGLMRSLANELAQHMIRVNTIHPTQVDTDMLQNPAMYELFCPDIADPTVDDFAPRSQRLNALPVPWVTKDDTSNALLFLVSDDARYITGATLPVDAGANVALAY